MKPSADTGRSTQNQFEVVVDTLVGLFNEGNPAFCLEKEKGILEIRVNQIHHSSLKFFVVQEFFALRSLIQAEFEKILGQKLELIVSHPPSGVISLRNITSTEHIGVLNTIVGTVTRTSDSKPELLVGSFRCMECGQEVTVEQQFSFTEPKKCPNGACKNLRRWALDSTKSVFTDWQLIKIQECDAPSGAMPRSMDVIIRGRLVETVKPGEKVRFTGCTIVVPDVFKMISKRSQDARENINEERSVQNKDLQAQVEAEKQTGKPIGGSTGNSDQMKAAGAPKKKQLDNKGVQLGEGTIRSLSHRFLFLAQHIFIENKISSSSKSTQKSSEDNENEEENEGIDNSGTSLIIPEEENETQESSQNHNSGLNELIAMGALTSGAIGDQRTMGIILKLQRLPNLMDSLVKSFAPHIYGHELIKKALLLMLVGGVEKVTSEGIHLRGNINVCLVGDPGTGKSQFLKYVNQILPRSIYTSGKTSSAAGLTASVVKDAETGEFTIEAGALMLSDQGICCIDEFDKMDSKDQVAIHEAMEQQTISIAKAGIRATLNARSSILAAANPIGGRYDAKKSLRRNLNMTSPIMSRFDLFFVITDDCNPTIDLQVAQHILKVHQMFDSEAKDDGINAPQISKEEMIVYLQYTRNLQPMLTQLAMDEIVKQYVILRQQYVEKGNYAFRITIRQLESIIRLSEAFAKLELSDTVEDYHVVQASALIAQTIIKVDTTKVQIAEASEKNPQTSRRKIIKDAKTQAIFAELKKGCEKMEAKNVKFEKAFKAKKKELSEINQKLQNFYSRRAKLNEESKKHSSSSKSAFLKKESNGDETEMSEITNSQKKEKDVATKLHIIEGEIEATEQQKREMEKILEKARENLKLFKTRMEKEKEKLRELEDDPEEEEPKEKVGDEEDSEISESFVPKPSTDVDHNEYLSFRDKIKSALETHAKGELAKISTIISEVISLDEKKQNLTNEQIADLTSKLTLSLTRMMTTDKLFVDYDQDEKIPFVDHRILIPDTRVWNTTKIS